MIARSYLAGDVEASQKRDLLLPTVMTFLAAEGVSALYCIQGPEDPAALPQLCGSPIEPIAQHTEIALLFRSFQFVKPLQEQQSNQHPEQEDDEHARLGVD